MVLLRLKNYYQILGISESCSASEIKKAFRVLAKKYHPDKTSQSDEKFKEINEAYSILGNIEKRKQYDQLLNKGHIFVNLADLNVYIESEATLTELIIGKTFEFKYKIFKKSVFNISSKNMNAKLYVNLKTEYYPITYENGDMYIMLKMKNLGSIFEIEEFNGFSEKNIENRGDLQIKIKIITDSNIKIIESNIIHIMDIDFIEIFNTTLHVTSIFNKKYVIDFTKYQYLSNIESIIPENGVLSKNGTIGNYIFSINIKKPKFDKLNIEKIIELKKILDNIIIYN